MRPIQIPTVVSLILCSSIVFLAAAPGDKARAPEERAAAAPPAQDPQDGRAGTVFEQQGQATVRPVGRTRWTPVGPKTVLMPGDLLRTSPRGANAVEMHLSGGARAVVGPGALVEVLGGSGDGVVLRILRGEVEVESKEVGKGARSTVRIAGPGGFDRKIEGRAVLRGAAGATERLAEDPRWLTGFRASTTDEWLGSLVAQVDGREVPLSVGYHKVDVEIKDQIARTTVEESFVNSTRSRLEGVFYFPLPADASISGFGMWIGDELVEADIVEKQRARAIFEDILRRKKDPGLLEWSGGNLFKARVFPIEPHSEKRIRIRYTQVLPLEGDTLRYRYALRSDLLKSHPLRQLQLRVAVDSVVPLAGVESPTHEMRIRHAEGSAVCEFDAEEYTPERDFELRIRIARREPLAVSAHRRGDDGYFMVLLSPPGEDDGAFRRELVTDKALPEVIVLCDTSASMDEGARAAQAAFLDGLFALLGDQDRFRLYTCDVDVHAFREDAVPVDEQSVAAALAFLEKRPSLGWTDLDLAFARVLRDAATGTMVVYVGDGIGTTGDADPVALAERLGRLARGARVTCHAVSTSSTYEQAVLQAIARIGGGSLRAAGEDPAATALALVTEATRPTLRNLKVRFEGLDTARVYPAELPNLAAGTQQVVLGRYLPGAGASVGRVIVEGERDGAALRWVAGVTLPADDAGNSFIPRLWARRHLDALLAQGRSAAVVEDIVSFSEEYGVMTPYTSFLVLESDEDRERYGVERRVHMRDGERFFAAGREHADSAVLREQMKLARTWRLRLRARMLAEIARLGRDLPGAHVAWGIETHARSGALRSSGRLGNDDFKENGGRREGEARWNAPDSALEGNEELGKNAEHELDDLADLDADPLSAEPEPIVDIDVEAMNRGKDEASSVSEKKAARRQLAQGAAPYGGGKGDALERFRDFDGRGFVGGRVDIGQRGGYGAQLGYAHFLFPGLEAPPPVLVPQPEPDWPAAVKDLLRSLDRRPALARLDGGIDVGSTGESLHALRGTLLDRRRERLLLGGAGFYATVQRRGDQQVDHWVHDGRRGVLSAAFRLGRRRDAVPADQTAWPMPLGDLSTTDLVQTYRAYDARVEAEAQNHVRVVLTAKAPRTDSAELWIDRDKNVLVERRSYSAGVLQSRTVLSDFVEVSGQWWAQRLAHFDGDGRTTWRQQLTVNARSKDEILQQIRARCAQHQDVIFLDGPDPDVDTAKQAIHERHGRFADHLRLVLHFGSTQQWDRAWQELDAAEALVRNKPGTVWLRAVLLGLSRRGEELGRHLATLAAGAGAWQPPHGVFLAGHLAGTAMGGLHPDESMTLLEQLRPLYFARGDDSEWRSRAFWTLHVRLLEALSRWQDALPIRRRLCEEMPGDVSGVLACVQTGLQTGARDAALAQLGAALAERALLAEYEAYQLYARWTDLLWQSHDLDRLYEVATAWIGEQPTQETAYARYLSVLYFLDREDEADRWIRARFDMALAAAAAAAVPTGPDAVHERAAEVAATRAAVRMALGQGWNFYAYQLDPRGVAPLRDLARGLVAADERFLGITQLILQNHLFTQTDECTALRVELIGHLTAPRAIEEMPLARLALYIGTIDWDPARVAETLWRDVVDRLRARWAKASEPSERQTLAYHVLMLLDRRNEREAAIAFARERLARATDDMRPGLARELTVRLGREPWSAAIENELFALVPRMAPPNADPGPLDASCAGAIRALADALYEMRRQHLLGPAEEYEKLSRAELRKKMIDARHDAQKALAARFDAAARAADPAERPFYEIEALCFSVELGADLRAVDGAVRELLGSLSTERDPTTLERPTEAFRRLLRERCSLVLAYAATRRASPEGLADGVLELYASGEQDRQDQLDWRYQTWRLLLALDRPDALAKALRAWIVPSEVQSHWRIALGYLLAETGQVEEATAQLERVAAADELGPAEYSALADWHLVLGNDTARERALLQRYRTMPEQELQNRLYRAQQDLARRGEGVPQDLDPDTLRMLEVLLGKSSQPANHVSHVENLYRAVKDFRLLESLANGVLGHSPEQVYPFLGRVDPLLQQVHEEATCDALAERIGALRAEREQPTDKRALTMLCFLVERRASMVLNAPGPHAERGLHELRAAFKGEWLPGEKKLMAELLASLGKIAEPAFAAEQRRQLAELHHLSERGGVDRLRIAAARFRTAWAYDAADLAIDGLGMALDEYWQQAGRMRDASANNELETLCTWHEELGRFLAGESLVLREQKLQTLATQQAWLEARLFQLWVRCLAKNGAVSIGRGEVLYRAARTRIGDALFACPQDQIPTLLSHHLELHRTAWKNASIRSAGQDLDEFAHGALFELAPRAGHNSQSLFSNTAEVLTELNGPLSGLRLLVRRLDEEPKWLARVGRSGWQSFSYSVARWRTEAGDIGALGPQLLRIVLRELERDLTTMQQHNRVIYQRSHGWFWTEKADDFLRTALKVVELHGNSPARQLYAADYLWWGLQLHAQAITVLAQADARQKLEEDGQYRLVTWLQHEKRWAESLPLLERLCANRPDRLDYRLAFVVSLHELGRDADAFVVLDETRKRLEGLGRWDAGALASVAQTCLQCSFWPRCVVLYDELIPLHQRTHPSRGIGDGSLSSYYSNLARAHGGLGNADAAVDAASAAVVAWGKNRDNRRYALDALRAVIAGISDLDGYVARWNAKVEAQGLDAALIRKVLGRVYLEKRAADRAVQNLLLARELGPDDAEVHTLLVQAYDQMGDAMAACEALSTAARSVPSAAENSARYADLGRRYAELGRAETSERAWTSLVEILPEEAEGHRLLAQHRRQERRFADEVVQWQQVVRVRSDEPDGFFELAQAQIAAGRLDDARDTLRHVISAKWDARFGDVRSEASRRLGSLEPGRTPR